MKLALGAFCLLVAALAAVASADADGDSVKKKKEEDEGGQRQGEEGEEERGAPESAVPDVDVSELKKEHRDEFEIISR